MCDLLIPHDPRVTPTPFTLLPHPLTVGAARLQRVQRLLLRKVRPGPEGGDDGPLLLRVSPPPPTSGGVKGGKRSLLILPQAASRRVPWKYSRLPLLPRSPPGCSPRATPPEPHNAPLPLRLHIWAVNLPSPHPTPTSSGPTAMNRIFGSSKPKAPKATLTDAISKVGEGSSATSAVQGVLPWRC